MRDTDQDGAVRDRLLGVIVAVLVLGALKAAEPVVLPLAFSLFVVLLAWPLQGWLQRRMPEAPAYGLTLVALLGVAGVLQIVIGSYVDPRLQGRSLSLSPFAVLLAVVFWGWMWGIPGSLIGVPLTAALMIAFREFASTRWLAELLNNERPDHARRAAEPKPPA